MLTIEFDDPEKMLTYDDLSDPGLSHRKTLSKRFQLQFSVHHKNLIKTNKKQSIITMKSNSIFQEKSYGGLL